MKFLTGLSLSTWLTIGAGIAFAVLTAGYHYRGNEIDTLRQSVATERAAHAVTLASVDALKSEIADQNAAIEQQRANIAQAQADLSIAVNASAGAQGVIERLTASSRSAPAGPACEPSAVVKEIWK